MLLISRLSKLGGTGTDAARLELSNVIHQSLKDADQELELLSTQVDDEIGDGSSPNTAALNSKIHKLTEDMKM
jgi:protein transport protein SEC20